MTETGLEFRILVIVIYLIFVICDLEFLMHQCSTNQLLQLSPKQLGSGSVAERNC